MGLFGFKSRTDKMSAKELQDYAMKYGRKNNLSDKEVADMFGAKIKQKQAAEKAKDMPLPKSKPKRQTKSAGGYMKKAEMAYGGMANGKKHNYACGGSVHSKK